jgi:hypothetical protein
VCERVFVEKRGGGGAGGGVRASGRECETTCACDRERARTDVCIALKNIKKTRQKTGDLGSGGLGFRAQEGKIIQVALAAATAEVSPEDEEMVITRVSPPLFWSTVTRAAPAKTI